jgi:hypothetical protein
LFAPVWEIKGAPNHKRGGFMYIGIGTVVVILLIVLIVLLL